MKRYDVVIVGGGPAGSATATFLARSGMEVLVVDRFRFPRAKVCGEYMSPQALSILKRLGVLDEILSSGARRLQGLAVWSEKGSSFRGDYREVDDHAPFLPHGLAVRREIFDEILLRKAASTPGVTVREGFNVRELLRSRGRVVGIRGRSRGGCTDFSAPLVIGADGIRSRVSRLAGLARPPRNLEKFAFRAYYTGLADENRGELHVGRHCYAGIAPVDQGLTNLNLVVDRTALPRAQGNTADFFEKTLLSIPGVRQRLGGARRVGPVRATGPMAWGCRSPVTDGVLLVGDAAGFVDPFTGEGIFMALRTAEIAAREVPAALEKEGPSRAGLVGYRRWRKKEIDGKIAACRGLQRILYRGRIFDWAIARLGRDPDLIARVLAVSGDYLPPRHLLNLDTILRLLGRPRPTSLSLAPVTNGSSTWRDR